MKFKQKKSSKITLSEKIADALTVKPRADIEDDQVFGTKPHTLSRADFSSSESEDAAVISDFRKRNVNLLSEISKKYEGTVVSKKDFYNQSDESGSENSDDFRQNDTLQTDSEDVQSENEKQTSGKLGKLKIQHDLDSEDVDSDSDAESEDYSITKFQKSQRGTSDEDSDQGDEESGEDDEESGEGDEEGYDISQLDKPMKEEFEHVKKKNVSEEVKKGKCVRNELLIWESLLEMRIHLQRCVNTANQMPMPDTFIEMKKTESFIEENKTTTNNVANMLDKFLTLQNLLLKNFPETKSLVSKKDSESNQATKQDSDEEIPSDTDNEEIPSDTEPEDDAPEEEAPKKEIKAKSSMAKKRKLEDYEKELSTSHKSFKTFRDTTIQKWNDKTRLATAANIKNAPTNTILQQISYILSDREKLIRRTQLKRSEYDIIGYEKPKDNENKDENGVEVNPVTRGRKDDDEYIPEIFDDSDFYHQLLRELIECKSADISDPVQLSRQWIALQQMRSKMKRKVDMKASKGRKIKYVVHNPLVNFMASEKSTTWNEESTNELYSSLFGKMFEHNNVGFNGNGFNIK
ncbi:protein AATF [Amyelois transitella]|uniref:protein AATF n=1 Tax=Amyelois transitella TaxID=680683 RepID=UPI002990587D|nr:protein AATF [Amyelois transitella]